MKSILRILIGLSLSSSSYAEKIMRFTPLQMYALHPGTPASVTAVISLQCNQKLHRLLREDRKAKRWEIYLGALVMEDTEIICAPEESWIEVPAGRIRYRDFEVFSIEVP